MLTIYKCACCTQSLSCVWLFVTPWTLPGSSVHGILRQEYWSGLPFPSPGQSSQLRDRIHVSCFSCLSRLILYHCATREALSRCLTHSKCWRIFATIDYDHPLRRRWDGISSVIQEAHIHGLCACARARTHTHTHTHTHQCSLGAKLSIGLLSYLKCILL